MKRSISLNIFSFFVIWSVFKAAESLLRTAGTKDIYAFYSLSWLYYLVIAEVIVGGVALVFAIRSVKPWGYPLGFIWIGIGIVNTIFTGVVGYINKPLMVQIMTAAREAQGRDTADLEQFINSPAYTASALGGAVVVLGILLFFAWHLYKRRAYFSGTSV